MPEIKSPIGNVQMSDERQLPTYKVEDPTIQERLPIEPPVRSSTPQKISVEDYNRYKQQIEESKFTARSSDNFDVPGERRELSQDDQQFLGFLQKEDSPPDRGQLQNARQKLKQKEASISPENKSKVEILLGLGKKTTTVVIDDHEIVLQNLTSIQTKKVLNAVAEYSALTQGQDTIRFDQIYVTKHMVVGFALKTIDNQSISELLGAGDTDETRETMVAEMESDAVDQLYNAYIESIGKKLKLDKDVGDEIKK